MVYVLVMVVGMCLQTKARYNTNKFDVLYNVCLAWVVDGVGGTLQELICATNMLGSRRFNAKQQASMHKQPASMQFHAKQPASMPCTQQPSSSMHR